MRPSQVLRSGGGDAPLGKYGRYLGNWGNMGSQTQKGVASYALSANRQGPLKGAFHAAIFNTWRRSSAQALYVVPPLVAAYAVLHWAIERNEYLNSKAGRLAEGAAEA